MNNDNYDYKLDYIARLFRSIRNKRYESYVIQRIWHRLNDPEIRFVTQQYFRRKDTGGFALADLYLPQFRLVVEIDEGQHAKNGDADSVRSAQIVDVSNSEIKRIQIFKTVDEFGNVLEWKSLDEVNQNIEDVVNYIRQRKASAGTSFLPWSDDILGVKYHQDKGFFCVSDNDYLKTIDDIAAVFNTHVKHKGYLRAGGFDIPGKVGYLVWSPSVYSEAWTNYLEDATVIIESENKADSDKRIKHYLDYFKSGEKRVTFYKAKDSLGFNFYRFIGVFQVDLIRSVGLNKTVWKRVSDRYDL